MDSLIQELAEAIQNQIMQKPGFILKPEQRLITSGTIDSVDIIKLVTLIEKKYRITISPADMIIDNFDTITAIAALVARCRKKA